MATQRKKKENVTITLSPYLKKQLDQLVDSGDFSSMSDLATMAFTEFVGKYNLKQKTEPSINDMVRAGIALFDAGEYEEAKKYFTKAKEIETLKSSEERTIKSQSIKEETIKNNEKEVYLGKEYTQ